MWWLVYRRPTQLQFAIIEAGSLVRGAHGGVGPRDRQGRYVPRGHKIDGPRSKRVPKAVVGKVLNRREAEAVLLVQIPRATQETEGGNRSRCRLTIG
jgi:hypothetical protein